MKVYAVKVGKKPGVYETWDACKEQVEGVKNATYKSFNSLKDANDYLSDKEFVVSSNVCAYVDGSFNSTTNEYSFGCVLLMDSKESHFSKKFDDEEYAAMRNVSGEIKGAAFIINHLIKLGIKEVSLFYDYEGIEKWYTGKWKTNSDATKRYVDFANTAKKSIKVNFVKVKSHSNDKYNDLADRLAKDVLGIK